MKQSWVVHSGFTILLFRRYRTRGIFPYRIFSRNSAIFFPRYLSTLHSGKRLGKIHKTSAISGGPTSSNTCPLDIPASVCSTSFTLLPRSLLSISFRIRSASLMLRVLRHTRYHPFSIGPFPHLIP